MCDPSVFCIATSHFQANHIVGQLKAARFPDATISALLADHRATEEFGLGRTRKFSESAIAGAGTGAILGVAWGWIAGIGALVIPGAGLFIASGPIIVAMSGATIGAALGGICGGLIGMGIPELEAKRYEGKILKGQILLSVFTNNLRDRSRATEIFNLAEAQDICVTESMPNEMARILKEKSSENDQDLSSASPTQRAVKLLSNHQP